MSVEEWFKPPLTVFIVWGGFVLCFLICGSSKRFIFCCECDDEPIDFDEETYEHLSSRRRQELDNLRSIAILRKLTRFTLAKETVRNNNEGKDESDEEKYATDVEDEPDVKSTEKRAVPIFCAVCLMEYEVSERVCWASNSDCTHVFHEDCILTWLVSLGRKRSKRQSFPRNPSDKRLLDYDLACPCCRQDFISGTLVLAPVPVPEGEENV